MRVGWRKRDVSWGSGSWLFGVGDFWLVSEILRFAQNDSLGVVIFETVGFSKTETSQALHFRLSSARKVKNKKNAMNNT